jgi:hypothetical protein
MSALARGVAATNSETSRTVRVVFINSEPMYAGNNCRFFCASLKDYFANDSGG